MAYQWLAGIATSILSNYLNQSGNSTATTAAKALKWHEKQKKVSELNK